MRTAPTCIVPMRSRGQIFAASVDDGPHRASAGLLRTDQCRVPNSCCQTPNARPQESAVTTPSSTAHECGLRNVYADQSPPEPRRLADHSQVGRTGCDAGTGVKPSLWPPGTKNLVLVGFGTVFDCHDRSVRFATDTDFAGPPRTTLVWSSERQQSASNRQSYRRAPTPGRESREREPVRRDRRFWL